MIAFSKMNGLGNEIVVVDLRGKAHDIFAENVRSIAAIEGLSFDQMMVLKPALTKNTVAFIDIWNVDGSPAFACGNGMRCVAALEYERFGIDQAKFETVAGILDTHRINTSTIAVDMGCPKFNWFDIPLKYHQADTRAIDLAYPKTDGPILTNPSVVNIGNPHVVFWVKDVTAYDLAAIGSVLEHDDMFPEQVNVSLAQVISPEHICLKVWERGAGLTKACGSAACAAVVAAARLEKTGRNVTATLPGGDLHIQWREDDRILMSGPWQLEYEGIFPQEVFLPPSQDSKQMSG